MELNVACNTGMTGLRLINVLGPWVQGWNLREKTGLAIVSMRNEEGALLWPIPRTSTYSNSVLGSVGEGNVHSLALELHGNPNMDDVARLQDELASFLEQSTPLDRQGEKLELASEGG
jgi:hypothetical protein